MESFEWKFPDKCEFPPNGKRVICLAERAHEMSDERLGVHKWRGIIIAEHVSERTVKEEDFLSEDSDNCDLVEYDEENDCYWVKEGWFESNMCDEINWHVSSEYKILKWADISID